MKTCRISFLEKSDIPEASKVLSKAMLKVPLHIAVFMGHGEKERRIIENLFSELLTDWPGITFLARIDRQIVGVMRMKSCDGRKISGGQSQVEEIDNLDWRKSHWLKKWARRDPSDQHWHLGPIGVLPPHQGKGIGSQLLSLFCKEVDACLAPAYLETDSEINVRFYERFGFQVIAATDILDVKNYFMWREPPS